MPSQLEILHRSLKANNYDVPDDYESFRSTLTAKGEEGYNNRYTLWKSLRDNNYDVPDDYNTFRDALFTPTKSAAGAQQKTPPAAVPRGTRSQAAGRGTTTNRTAATQSQEDSTGTGDWRQQMMADTSSLVRRSQQQVQQTANQVKYNQKRAGLQTQPVNLGQNPDVVEEETGRWDTETGAPEKRYLTSSGTEYGERAAADLEENVNDLQEYEQTVPGQLRKIDEQIASLEQRISEQESQREIDWVDADGRVHYKDGRTSDEAISNLDLALRDLKNARTMLQRDQQLRKSSDFLGGVGLPFTGDWFNNWKNFGYGIWDSLNDRSMYDFGLSDLQKAGAYMRIKNKIENGQELTEQETDLALAGMALAQAEQSVDLPTGYTAGETTAQMAPFMAQMAANPASGVGRAFARGAVRKFGRDGVKAVAMRAGARVLGNVAEAAALTGTLQAGQTAANVMNRYTGDTFEYDEEGKLHIGHWEEGEDGQPTFVDGGKGAVRSIYEGVTSSIIENFTELGLGGNLNKFLGKMAASRGGQAIGLGYITDLVGKVGSTPFARGMKKFAERTNWNGLIEEPLEEEYGIILNALLTGDNKLSDLWDSKQQADIFAGTMWFGGFMAGMNLAAYPFARRKMKKDLRAADINGQYAFGDEWDVIKSGIEEMDDNAVVDYLYGLKDDDNFNAEQKAALFAYTSRLKQYQGANTASMLMRMEGNLDENEAAQQNAYESGSEAEGPERNEVLKRYEAARQAVAEVFGIDEEEVDSRLGIDENSENAIADKALQVDFGEQVLEYLNARAAYNGMLDRVGDDIEAQVQASNEEVSRITNETGQVVGATMKADGSQVYVVSGDPATAETLVVRDAETGELKMIAPDALQSIEEPINAEELRLQREEEITNAGMQQAENEIEGKREFQLNDVVTLADGRQGQLGGVTPDGAFLLYTDDGKVTPVTNDQLNELATEVNGSPVEAAVPQQQTEEAEEEQPEEASGTENAENYAQNESEIIPEEEAAIVSQQTEQEAGGTDGQQVVDTDAMPMVGEGEDAEPDFSRAEPARAHRFIYDEAGLSRDEADQFIDANKKEAENALTKLQKKQPKIGTSLAKYRKEQAAWQQQVDEAQRQVDYWTNVQQIQQERVRAEQEAEFQARQEEAAGRQALLDEQRDLQAKVQTAKRVYGDYFDDDFTVPHDVIELVAMNMPRNISWEGREGVRGLQQELGLRRGVGRSADSNAFNSYLAKKGEGIGVEQAVHNIWESAMNELPNGDKRYDDSEIRNALLDMFMSAEKPSDIRDYVLTARIAEAEATRAAEDEAMRAAELDAWADAYNLTPEEREDFEDYISSTGEEISRMSDEEIQNIITIFANANQNTIDYEQNRRSQEVDREPDGQRAGREGEGSQAEVQGQGTEETGVPDSFQQGAEGSEAAGNREDISGDNVSGGALERPDVDEQRMQAIRQALTDAYRSGDKTAIGLAAEQVQAYVDEGLDDYRTYDEAIDDYEGREPEMLADQYITHVFLDRYVDDDEDQEYIVTGLKPWMRESPASVLPNMEVEEAALASQQTEQPSESKSERILNDGLINFLDQIGVEDLTVVDRMSNDEKVELDNLITDWEEVNDEYGRVIEENRDKIHSLNKAEKKKAENAVGAAQMRADAAFAPVEEYVNGLVTKYKVEEPEEDVSNDAEVMAQQTENTLGATSSAEEIAAQEARVDTNPTEAQKEAGNYQKGHIKVDGFDITIENPKGSVRRGTDASGQPWEVTMNNTYGYIRGTEGVDGDHIDVFLSDNPTSGNIYVIDQVDPNTGEFDEHKVMYGFADANEAKIAYFKNYSRGWKGYGKLTAVSREDFKKWIESSHRKTKPFAEYAIAKKGEAAVPQQQTEQREAAANFTITDAEYKTKRGKVLNMRLVKFERELTPEEQKAANALAKESRGWWSRDDGGFLMRDDESARAFAEKVMTPTDMADAKPLSLEDMQKATDDRQEQQSEPTPAQEEQPVQNEQQPTQKSQWVDDEDAARFEELKRRMRAKLGGQMNMGVDPEILAIGAEMAFYVVKHGARKFGEYARAMVEELGDAIRPYLKSFYNGAREFPEMEQYAEDMTPYEEVRAFDVANFDKSVMDVIATAQQIVNEQEAEQQAEEAEKNLKDQRNEERKQVEQENTRPATPEDLEQAPLVWYQGKKYGIMMLVHEGSQVSATQFEKPRVVRVVLSNGQSVEPDELRVDNTVQAPVEEAEPVQYDLFGNPIQEPAKKSSRKTEKKSAKVSDSQEKVVSLQKENDVNDEAANAEQQNAGIRHEQGSERKPSGTGEGAGQEAQRADDARRRGGSEPNRTEQPGLQRLTQEVATQSQQNGRNTDLRVPNGDTSEPVPTRPGSELSGSGSHSTQFTQPQNLRNNRAERGKDYAPKGIDARIEANINAIELMQRLMENGEQATPAQMKVLRQYSGWGGLGKAFKEKVSSGDSGYNPRLPDGLQPANPINVRLRELLSPEEYDAANMSRNSAYYTPAMVIDSMWDIARAMGFRGGNVLEGSAGIGNIIGAMPKDMSERSSIHAVEIDQTTGNILSLLYPDAQVDVQGFEQTQVENGSVDLAITNVPFVTGLRVMDTTGDKDLSRKFHDIHDFCIAKNIRKLREGGIGIFITSSGTLDNSTKLREWIVGEGGADVVGAFRLNNDTFGGTGATSDIIVVRKRVNGKKSANAIDVLPTTGVRVADYDTGETKKVKGEYVPVVKQLSMDYNKYFAEHPENMGGEMKFAFEEGDTFRPTSKALYPVRGKNQEELLKDWVTSFAGKEWEAAVVQQQTEQQPAVYEELGADVKEGSMVVSNGELCVAQRGKAVPLGLNATKVKGKTKVECFNSYQNIKKSLADVLAYQTENEGDEGLQPLLDKLNRAYDSFVRTFGHLHKNTSIAFLRNDVDWPNILALEKFAERATVDGKRVQEFGKTDIFKTRVVEKEKEPSVDNVRDGIIASIYQFGRIDVPWMVEQLNKVATQSQHTEQEVRDEIVKSGLGFEDPGTKEMVVSYEYLSGNVREKLQQAQDNNSDGRYDANIKALEKVVPMDIPAHLIDFSIGSSWIDPKLYEDYVKEKTGIEVQFTNAGGTWYMKAPRFLNEEKNRAMGVHSEMLRKTVFGTQLIEAAMQNKTITVSETHKKWDGSTETIIDKEATAACGNKIDEIRQDFKDWARGRMQADDEYARQVERKYNDMFNNYVPKSIPDEFVPAHFGGASMKITLRPHQAKAVIRGTTQPLLLAHEVGTGKTFTLISTAMEMRRLGTARKPMIVVQNATVGQFVESAKVLYPNAKVLTLEDKDHTGEGRKNFYAKIKYNDWDMIVVPQSVFERIPDSEERQMAYIQDKIDEKMAVLEQMKDADAYGESAIVRQAEKEIEQLQAEKAALTTQLTERKKEKDEKKAAVTRQNAAVRAQEMLDRETDDVENFDDMGIDAILVDEAHEYKHLGFATAMQRGVKGVDPSYSKKAQGVYLKTQAVLEKNNGRNVIFATGTPISNTAAEIWTFMRYLMPADTMKEYDIYYFDDFVRNFGNLQQMLEFTTSGKFKENNRFAGYVNLPELVRIWSGVADTVLTKEAGGVKDKIPELEGGKAQDLYLPQTKALRSVMKFVKAQLEEYEKMSGKEKKENSHIPLTMYGIAKAAAVDARLVVDDAQDDEHSKTNEAVRQTLKSLEETKSYKGTVAIFADNYQNKHSGFNLYEDIRKKLVAAGVPEEQIVVMKSGMSVKKKLEIFDKVNRGEVRVIMGSTFTLGTGVNIQERLHTLIHVDAPNRPMDYTQRNGRILRQGNLHKEMGKPVRVLRFGVEDSLDVTAYQRLKTKGAIADSIMNGKQMMANSMENRVLEEEEDVFGDTVAQLSGSEYAMLKNQAEKDVRKYEAKRKQWEFDQTYVHSQIPKLEGQIKTTQRAIEENKHYLERVATVSQHTGPMITIGQRKFESVEAMADYIKDFNKSVKAAEDAMRESGKNDSQVRRLTINVGGIDFDITTEISVEVFTKGIQLFTGTHRNMTYSCKELGIVDAPVKQSLLREALSDITENVITGNDFRERIERGERAIERDKDTLQQLRERDGKPFEYADELAKAHERYDEYTELMKKELEEKEKKYAEMDAEVSEAADVVDAEEAEEDSSEDEGVRFRDAEEAPAPQRTRERTAGEQRQAEAYAQRQWRRAHVVADETIRLLGLEGRVTVMDFPIGLTGKRAQAKGWYDTKTGKTVVVMNNHRSPEDVFETILHEGVAHYGLRQLFGEHFDTFLDEVYKNATPEIRAAIDAEVAVTRQQTEQKARREATEEYLARLAEDTDFERAMKQGWWQKIKSAFLDMLHKLGFGEYAGPALTDNELRYILWRSYENLKDQKREREGQKPLRRNVWNPFKAAEDIVMQENLKVGNFEPTPSPSLKGKEKEQRQVAEPKKPTLSVASMQPRNAVEQMYQDFKERYGNAMLMMRDDDSYFALGDDALTMERLFAGRRFIHGVMSDGRYSIPVSELDMVLPVLVRAGNRVAIADAPTGNAAREGEQEVDWQDGRRIMERLTERYNSKELVFFDMGMSDEELFDSLSFLHPFRDELENLEDFRDFMAFVREKLNEDKGHAFYNSDSKKIFIFADRLKSSKAEETFYHENIHGVLHDWYGDGARTIADRFWDIAPEKGKTSKSHVTANYDAEEQHEELFTYWLAKSMVDGSVDDMLNMFADADKQRIDNILKSIGYDRERETEERKPRGAEGVSERTGGEGLQGLQVQEELDDGLRFRSGDGGGFTSARAQYEAKTAGGAFKFRESWQDSMLSLKRLQDAIAAESGEYIEDFENAYLAENRMHGKSKNEAEHYDRNYYQPLLQEVHQLVDYLAEQGVADPFGRGGVVTYQTVDDYLKAKHGLERNQVFAFREAAKQKAKETIDEQKRQLQQDADDGNITTDELRKELKRLDENFGKTVQGIIDAFANDPEVVRQKRNYENGLLTYSEYLSALIPLRKKYVMRAEPKTDDGGNVVSDNYYDEHERDYGGLSELMSPEDYATIEALREMASLTIDPENKRELYKRVREEEERVFREAQEEAMKAVDAIEVDSAMKEKRDNGTIVPFVYLRDTAERRKHISDLWSRVNDATKKTLQTSYEGGMMSREQYNNVRAMFDYYVPLRGWEDNNAEDVYDYVAKRSAFSPSVKKAYGRASKADSPLATIGNMAVSQIIISNKNLMRQHFLNMVLNHPSSLISVSEKWYVRMGDVDGEAVWEEREPDIKPGMTADEIASEIETFNEEMRQLQEQGDAIPAKGKLHLNLHATKAQKDEHVVEVQRNGKVYKLYINGNPRAAQALNGTNITEGDAAWMQKLSRTMAANFTSRNPAFIISNLSRDFTMAAASVVIKEDKAYSKKFAENAVKVLRPRMGRAATRSQRTILTGLLPSLMRKYLRGELDPIDEAERYFQEFMEQGGETGFTNMLSVEKFKSKMEKEFKKTAGHEMDLAKAFGMMADTFEFYNRCAEDATRFIVYMTSRQMGKSVTKSIADAKDVTLNFNRKGAGGMGNATFRNIYIFVNPAIQALSNVYEMMTKHKLKFTAVTLSWVAAGAVLPILNTLMLNLLGGDDDKDTYWDLPDYVRKNNAVFWVPGTHTFVTIPLAQEFRVFYGIGELASAMSMGHTPDSWGKETLSSFMDLLPVNPTGAGGDLLVDFMPTPLQPIVQARDNINFTGYPIYRDNQGNKYEPTWQKAYHGTPSWMVKTSKLLNEATGGNEHYQGWIDGTLTNPALWNHMLQGYLGGMYSFLAHSAGVVTDVVLGEMPKMYEVPIANRFINVPLEREKRARLGNEYYDLVKEHDRMQSMMAKYRKDAKGEDPELKETAERYVDMAKEIDKKIDWERNGKTYEPQTSIDAGFEKRYRRYKKIHDYKRSIEKVVNGESKKSENRLNQLVREMQESLRNINEDF